MALFDLSEAHASYNGERVLDGVSLSVEAGEKIALVGRSGAGKSTLLKLLYDRKDSECALVPQDLGLVHTLSVFHNVFMGRLHNNPTWYNLANLVRPFSKERTAVTATLEKVGLQEKFSTPVGELSGGQQQRTGIARALYQGCDTFLGDEPVSAVDEHQARRVMKAITESHKTVILAMHDVQLALQFCSRIVGISGGGIVLDCSSDGMNPSDLDELYNG
ncbi:MAG: ABC transporter [Rhodospirillaceae bacterium]|nr:ABC transporter [Rhodospirillaceae bacterium]